MYLSDKDIKKVKDSNCQFVSFKYLDNDSILKQIDIFASDISDQKIYDVTKIGDLKPIEDKSFIDPFRSSPTITFFCLDLANKNDPRQIITEAQEYSKNIFETDYFAEISFWTDTVSNDLQNYTFATDPVDMHANLRSDIVSILNRIGIKTTLHYHGKLNSESVIGVRGITPLDLADNILITKFVIANAASSYGLQIEFTNTDRHNLKLFISHKQNENCDLELNSTKAALNYLLESAKNSKESFALKKYNIFHSDARINLILEIQSHEIFISYLFLSKLLQLINDH